MEKTIKYLENGEYHYATVRSVGDLAQLKTTTKETLVEAINELWNGGGNVDPSKVPNPEGYDKLVQDVADAVKNQQEISRQWIEWKKEEAQLTEERKQAYLQAMKEMQEAIDKAKADAAALGDKTAKLDEQITKTFSELNTNIQNMHEQLQKEADRMNKDLQDTKGTLSTLRTDLQNTQMDNGRIHDELTNINGKFEHKVWQTDLDPLKEQIERAETSVQQTKDELLGKASHQDLDTVSNTVSRLDTQLRETAKGVEISVKKDELGGEIAEALTNKTNILLGTRRFTTNNWTQRNHVEICSDPWKGFLVAKQNSPIEGIQQAYEAKVGTTYTFSLYAKMDNLDASNKPQIILAKNNLDTSLDTKIDVWRKDIDDITSDFKRYDLTFTPSEDCTIYPHVISNSNNPIFVCGYQLEIGKELTPWEPNQEDVGDYVEKSEAQFNVYNDKIQALTEKQRQQGDTQEKLRTEVTQTAEGVKQVSESLKDTNGDITKLRGDLERTADHMKSEYETYTNKAVGQISDSTLNLIRNSSFQNKDEDFAQWQNISAKANVRQDENGLRWVELTQSGLTTNNPEGITSNYFNIKQGKVTVAVDIKSGDKSSLDNDSVLSLELYNDVKKRVDFYDVSLSQLGLSKELLGDHKVHRGLYRLGIDRNDAKYMTVKAKLVKNGDLYFTNFSARLSSIDDGAYEPNPDDINQQILKQNTKIEQNAKEVAIKANSIDVTRDIKSAVDGIKVGGINLLKDSAGPFQPKSDGRIDNYQWFDSVTINMIQGQQYTVSGVTNGIFSDCHDPSTESDRCVLWLCHYNRGVNQIISSNTTSHGTTFIWNYPTDTYTLRVNTYHPAEKNQIKAWNIKIESGNKKTDWAPAPEDISEEIKSAKDAAIQVANDQVNIRVNELTTTFDDKLNKRVNEVKTASEKFTSDGIEQVVTKITDVQGNVDKVSNNLSNLDQQVKSNNGGGINLLKATDFANIDMATLIKYWGNQFTIRDGVAIQVDGRTLKSGCDDATQIVQVEPDTDYTLSFEVHYSSIADGGHWDKIQTFLWEFQDAQCTKVTKNYQDHARSVVNTNKRKDNIYTIHTQPDCRAIKVIFRANPRVLFSFIKPKLERGNTATPWTVSPEDTAQSISDTNKRMDTQTLDSANVDNLKTQGRYFVKNLTGNPIGGWVYVDVTGNNNDRVKQDVYQDNGGKHMSRRLFGNSWTGWEQGAYLSDVNNVKTEVTASVKNLGDRVTTQVNSVETKVDGIQIGGRNLAVGTDKDIVIDDTNNKGTQGWQFVTIHLAEQPKLGDQITISAEGVLTGNGHLDDYTVILYNETTTDPRSVQGRLKPGQRSSVTVKVDNLNGVGNTVLLIYAGNPSDTQGKKNVVHHLKIEKGNKPTEWSLAPEDTLEAIKEVNTKWDVANGQIQGKVTETQVQDLLNKGHYATREWSQGQIKLTKDQFNVDIKKVTSDLNSRVNEVKTASEKFTSDGIEQTVTKITNVKNDVDRLDQRVATNNGGGINLLRGTGSEWKTLTGVNWFTRTTSTGPVSAEELNVGETVTYTIMVRNNSQYAVYPEVIGYVDDAGSRSFGVKKDEGVRPGETKTISMSATISENTKKIIGWLATSEPGAATFSVDAKNEKLERGSVSTPWSPNPQDAKTYTDSQIVNTNKKIDTQTLDSANIDEMRTQGHYFVRNLTGNPIGGWVYVDIIGNNNDRVRQDVYADQNNQHKYRSWNGSRWSDWEQGAYLSDVKTEVTASVKNLGDRVTTEVNSITTRMSDQIANAVELIQKSDFSDGSKGSWTVQSIISATNPAPPAELGISGMKVIQSNVRDSYEDVWHSVTPGEKFNIDFWCAPSSVYDSSFGLVFYDANKKLVPNNQWLGVRTDHSAQWKHYTGEITAPGNSAFAKPWFQIDMPFGQHNTSWLAKPHIRRQDPRVTEAIKEVNTKWDVANGQIQGKVTATDVNNILNGKGYATQSWAQTMFQMKSDSITLQAVRDNITNGIQNQVNDTNSRLANTNSELTNTKNKLNNIQVGERNLAIGTNRGKTGWWVDPGNGAVSTDTALLNGVKGLHINNTKKSTSWWVVCYPFDMGKLKPNTYYTISFDIQTSENINGGATIDLARGDSSGSPFVEGQGGNITTRGGEITHVTRTLKTGRSIESNGQALYINSFALGRSNVVNIANLMIVEGTQSSIWKPAPEDQGSGQNLLRGTADFSWPTGIGMNNSFEFNYERFDDSTIAMHLWNIKGNGTGIYTKWGGAFPDGQIQVGEQYTFSFDVKGSGKFLTVRNESEPGKGVLTLDGVNVPSEWARMSVTGTIQALDKAFVIYFAQGANVWIKNVQIERGAIATPWTPHPFDDKDKGVNLLKSTAYWNPADWNHISNNVWYDDNWVDSNGHKAYGHHTAWQGLGQTVYVTPGVYTWSAQIYLNGLDSNDYVYPYMGDSQYNGTVQVQDIRKPMLGVNDQNKWINYSTTFYVKNAGNLCVRPELNRDHGNIHVGSQKLERGMVATPWSPSPYDSDPKNVISAINITPDQIKIASNKIVIDGNTDIRGTLRVPTVKLQGKSGMIGLDGNKGIIISSADTLFQTRVTKFGMDFLTTTNGQKEIMGGITTGFSTNNGNLNGISIVLDTQQKLGYPYGGDFFSIGNTTSIVNDDNRSWNRAMDYDASGQLHQGGFMWYEHSTLTGDGRLLKIDGAYDPLLFTATKHQASGQSDKYQPTIRLGYSDDICSNAGITFLWNQVKPFGDTDISNVGSIWFNGQRFVFGWASHGRMFGNQQQPAFMRLDDKGGIMSGIAFAPGSTWDLGTGAWNITASVMNHGG